MKQNIELNDLESRVTPLVLDWWVIHIEVKIWL